MSSVSTTRARRPRWSAGHHRGLLAGVCATLIFLAGWVAPGATAATLNEPADPTLVETAEGALRGRASDDHLIFEGIPYAKPPVGGLRFRSPQPVQPWQGVRDARQRASMCAQTNAYTGSPRFFGNEDCLYLNVHAPIGAKKPLPVMVFLHGGGFSEGGGATYDPRRVTRQGGVMVVTINYRLGSLGFLAHPALDDRAVGNFGIADQQAALRWVRRNIAFFGGDPGNVTLWGESAGAYSLCAQLASPSARGLFDRAIMQSGPCGNTFLSRDEARHRARRAVSELACEGPDVAACLREAPASTISGLRYQRPRLTRYIADLQWIPVAGTPVLPVQPNEAVDRGIGSQVPLLLGGTREEMRNFILDRYFTGLGLVTEDEYPRLVSELYGSDADRVLAEYPHERYDSPSTALAVILTDEGRAAGACQLIAYADRAAADRPVFMYEFAEPAGLPDPKSVPGFEFGANHGADVPYFFDSYHPNAPGKSWTEAQQALARRLIGHWTSFARAGEPGGDWAPYADGRAESFSTTRVGDVDVAADHNCSFWR